MSNKPIWSLAVVVPTITGRENEFQRCLKSLKLAENLAPRDLEIKYFTSKDSSREQLLKDNLEEICKCSMVTFVDDDDYVSRSFFSLPERYDDEKIYSFESRVFSIGKAKTRIDRKVVKIPMLVCGKSMEAYRYSCRTFYLQDCHLWGYYFPSKMIKRLTEELLIPRPEVTGPWEDVCYWAWILTNYGDAVRLLNSPIYFHSLLSGNSLIDKLTREEADKKMSIVKSINPNLEAICDSISGNVFYNILSCIPPDTDGDIDKFVDLLELREHLLTKKEKSAFRRAMRDKAWVGDKSATKFLELLKCDSIGEMYDLQF